jgi:hypothetical protein
VAEPPAASWLQVQPGRFVRVEELQPGDPTDESVGDSWPHEPHDSTPLDEPGAPPESVLMPADAVADVSVSQVEIEVLFASQDNAGATAQSDR